MSKHVHKTIKDHSEGIAFTPLTFIEMKNFFQEVDIPFSTYVNRCYRTINGTVQRLENLGYVKTKIEETTSFEDKYYIASHFMHKLRKEGFLNEEVRINEEKYKLKSLSFGEMMENSLIATFVVGDCIVQPLSPEAAAEKLGYKRHTVMQCISALKYCGLIQTKRSEGKRNYSLCNDMKKVLNFLEIGKANKERKVSRMRKYVEVKNLADKGISNISEISKLADVPFHAVHTWLTSNQKPRINEKIAQLLLNQRLLSEEDIETFRHYDIITSPEYKSNGEETLIYDID